MPQTVDFWFVHCGSIRTANDLCNIIIDLLHQKIEHHWEHTAVFNVLYQLIMLLHKPNQFLWYMQLISAHFPLYNIWCEPVLEGGDHFLDIKGEIFKLIRKIFIECRPSNHGVLTQFLKPVLLHQINIGWTPTSSAEELPRELYFTPKKPLSFLSGEWIFSLLFSPIKFAGRITQLQDSQYFTAELFGIREIYCFG